MVGVEIEEKIYDAIQQYCQTDEDIVEAKQYFNNMLVNEMIDGALEE